MAGLEAEYRALRERVPFLTLCKTKALAAQLAVEAVERLAVDAPTSARSSATGWRSVQSRGPTRSALSCSSGTPHRSSTSVS